MPDAVPYSRLAPGYDAVMAHVDYPGWARYIARLLGQHAPDAREVVEIGCGTGSLTLALREATSYSLRGYDGVPEMVEEARRKAAREGFDLPFGVLGFHEPLPAPSADAIVLVYDGLNYLLHEDEVSALLDHVVDGLVPGGVFVVDQSTPQNSLNHVGEFDDDGTTDAFDYTREGTYDLETRLHTTTFELHLPDGSVHREAHVQRAYTRAELDALLDASSLEIIAAYDAFSTNPASDESERIHWVLQRPA
ncbi:MAG: class I SAM-dependent methyltransferase [Bacteroidota bacterium]